MSDDQKQITVAFYRTNQGKEPVREWLKDLDPADRKIVGDDLQTLEYGWPVGMPLCRPISSHKGMWEARSNLASRRIARVLFCIAGGRMVLLHGFIKKTRKTPDHELKVAAKRMKGEKND
jgi:phage-related protein